MFATLFVKKRITHKVLAKQFVHKTLRAVDETFEDFDPDEIVISIKSKLRNESEKNDIIMMLIGAVSEICGDLSNLNTSNQTKYH